MSHSYIQMGRDSNGYVGWYQCNCCPYGYHIDLDFVRYCESIERQSECTGSIKRRKDRRRQRQSMEVLLGLTPPPPLLSELEQAHCQTIQEQEAPRIVGKTDNYHRKIIPFVDDVLDDVVNDFERTLQRSKLKLSNNLPDVTAVTENIRRVPSVCSMSSSASASSITVLPVEMESETKDFGCKDFDTVSVESCGMSPAALHNIREQMALSLERTKLLEEQVKVIPSLQAQIANLTEEKRLLLLKLHTDETSKLNRINGNYLINTPYNRTRSHSVTEIESPDRKEPPPPPPRRDFGVMCGVLTRNVGVGHQTPKTKTVSTETYAAEVPYSDKWLSDKMKFLNLSKPDLEWKNGVEEIHLTKQAIATHIKGTQTPSSQTRDGAVQTSSIAKISVNNHTQTLENIKTVAHVAITASPKTLTTSTQIFPESRHIGVSEDSTDDVLCSKCNIEKKAIAVGPDSNADSYFCLENLTMPRSKSFHMGEDKLNMSVRTRSVACQRDYLGHNKACQHEPKSSSKHCQCNVEVGHKGMQCGRTSDQSKTTDTADLTPPVRKKHVACEAKWLEEKKKCSDVACNTVQEMGGGKEVGGKDVGGRDAAGNDVAGKDVSGKDVSGKDVSGTDFSGKDVSGKDVSGKDVSGKGVGRKDVTEEDFGRKGVGMKDIGRRGVVGKDVAGNVVGGKDAGGNVVGGNVVGRNVIGGKDVGGKLVGGKETTREREQDKEVEHDHEREQRKDDAATPSRIPRPQIPTTPVENRKFKRQDTYTKIPAPMTSPPVKSPSSDRLFGPGASQVPATKPSYSPFSAAPNPVGLSGLDLSHRSVESKTAIEKVKQTLKVPQLNSAQNGVSSTKDTQEMGLLFTESSLYHSSPESHRKKSVPSKEMQGAMKVLNDYLHKPPSKNQKNQLKNAVAIVQQEWFQISSLVNANPLDVEDYLDCFEDISYALLEHIVNMGDGSGNTAMHYAVSHGNFDVVSILLDSKVCDINKQNNAGYTSIMLVSLAEVRSPTHANVVKKLFQLADLNIRAKQHGQTALMLAVSHGRLDMVSMLLEAGADINIQDEDGSTALMCAAEHGYVDIVKHFLSQPDCDSSITDVDGSTALNIAMEAGHRHIGVLLYAHERNLHGSKYKKSKSTSSSPKTPSSPHLPIRNLNSALTDHRSNK